MSLRAIKFRKELDQMVSEDPLTLSSANLGDRMSFVKPWRKARASMNKGLRGTILFLPLLIWSTASVRSQVWRRPFSLTDRTKKRPGREESSGIPGCGNMTCLFASGFKLPGML